MQRLYNENGFDAILQRCIALEIESPDAGTRELIMHEAFCCKKRTVRYCDAETGDEIALISHVTPASSNPRKPYQIISRLRIGDAVYEAAVPKW